MQVGKAKVHNTGLDVKLEQYVKHLEKYPEAQHHEIEVLVAQERNRQPQLNKLDALKAVMKGRPDLIDQLPKPPKPKTP